MQSNKNTLIAADDNVHKYVNDNKDDEDDARAFRHKTARKHVVQ
jgi:hypothetical protein